MNSVQLLGRLTRDVEVRYSQGATPVAVAKFGIAVARRFKKQGEADSDFLNCIAFGKTGENIEKFFSKGRMIALEGHIQTGSYEKDGKKIFTTDIIVDGFSFCGDSKEGGAAAAQSQPQAKKQESEDDDLPF